MPRSAAVPATRPRHGTLGAQPCRAVPISTASLPVRLRSCGGAAAASRRTLLAHAAQMVLAPPSTRLPPMRTVAARSLLPERAIVPHQSVVSHPRAPCSCSPAPACAALVARASATCHECGPGTALGQALARHVTCRAVIWLCFLVLCQCRPSRPGLFGQLYSSCISKVVCAVRYGQETEEEVELTAGQAQR